MVGKKKKPAANFSEDNRPMPTPLPVSGPLPSDPPGFAEVVCRYDDFHFKVLAWEELVLHLTFSAVAHDQAKRFLRQRFPAASLHHSLRLGEKILESFHLFATGAAEFSLPCHGLFLEHATAFRQRVWGLLAPIPYGEVRTYGQLAAELGSRGHARAVGGACHANPLALVIPCHRVVAAHGPGGFAGGSEVKERLLAIERDF
jgi:O-6-methylguanine DNA methyltransferase